MSVIFRQLFGFGIISGITYWFWRYFAPQHSTLVLDDKVVVISGAASGLGKALALSFAKRGTRIVLVGQHADSLETVHREIEPYASAVLAIQADVVDPEQHNIIRQKTLNHFGRIDVLVHPAGMMSGNLLTDYEPEQIREIIEVNLTSTILLTKEILPVMLSQGEGYILVIGSGLGRRAAPAFSPYVASKSGITGFADSLRQELAGTNIYVTLATPGWIQSGTGHEQTESMLKTIPHHSIESLDKAADDIVEGLVQGQHEVVLGGFLEQIGMILERISPRLSDWYWGQVELT